MAKNISGGKTGMLAMIAGAAGALTLVAGSYFLYQTWQVQGGDPTLGSDISELGATGGDEIAATTTPIAEPTAEQVSEPLAASAPLLPIFELIRIEADGEALFAGLAVPNSEVHLMLDGKDAAIVQADASGNFVAMINIGISDRPRVMTLVSVATDGIRLASETSAIIEPIEPALSDEADIADVVPQLPVAPDSAEPEIVVDAPSTLENTLESTPETAPDSAPDSAQVAEITTPEASQSLAQLPSPDMPEALIDQTGPDQTGPDQTGPDQTGPDQTGPDQTGPDQTGPDQTGPDQTGGVISTSEGGTGSLTANTEVVSVEPVQIATGDMVDTLPAGPRPASDEAVDSESTDAPLGDAGNTGTTLEGAAETSTEASASASAVTQTSVPSTASEGALGRAPEAGDLVGVDATPVEVASESTQGLTPESAPETPPILGAFTQAAMAEPAPPRVLLAGPGGITVLQNGGADGTGHANVTLDSITYSAAGEVQLSGRGPGDSRVRVYLNNQPIRSTQIAEDGQWRTPLPEVESGIYTLRVDELNADGSVASRVETPFLREDPAQIAAVAAEVVESTRGSGSPAIQAITVQPGSTLWSIATEKYGEGNMYVRVFNANRDVIRNPDLIYPGQVFTLPDE